MVHALLYRLLCTERKQQQQLLGRATTHSNEKISPTVTNFGQQNSNRNLRPVFLKGQTKLEWHLGQVGPKKFEGVIKGKKCFITKLSNLLGPFSPSATLPKSVLLKIALCLLAEVWPRVDLPPPPDLWQLSAPGSVTQQLLWEKIGRSNSRRNRLLLALAAIARFQGRETIEVF